ncbi:MAG: DNA repair protein [Lachnospiraceae bacterium]|jgi:nucleotidyltransferase/DNA polymerase involved in DNA repair|nr:DNA repair protein [Lachnospiraceae bacterium]
MEEGRTYLCIDLKSFYASVECVERGLDPMEAHLVVADPERTDKTICLAVSPALKELGVPNRCRVFQIPLGVPYVMAPPRMKLYMEYSAQIYAIYLNYVAKEDIHVYSIDEVFMDVTDYLPMYRLTAKELGLRIMQDVRDKVGVTATCGIGTNLYLAKIALDITAKHSEDCIGILDEAGYQKTLWRHRPLTDFWRIGPGIAARLAELGIYTMGQLAGAGEDVLYQTFGIDAELLIDHAWGRESVTIADIKAYKPKTNCLSSGQVLGCDYGHEKAKLAAKEMADALCLELVEKEMATESITLQLVYTGARGATAPVHGTVSMPAATSSARTILSYVERLYDSIETKNQPIQKIYLTFNRLVDAEYQQYDLFHEPTGTDREKRMQRAMLDIKKKFGKNAILKGMNLQEGATARERNRQIGGHKSGEKTENES